MRNPTSPPRSSPRSRHAPATGPLPGPGFGFDRRGRGAGVAAAGAAGAAMSRRAARPAGRAADARLRDDPGARGRTGGPWRPSPGSVYPTLQMLEDEGLIVRSEPEGRMRFTLTDVGR